jgi:hypothetical protein
MAASMATSPEVNEHPLFTILHRGMSEDFARLETAVDDLTLADRVDRARAMDHWFRGFAKVLRHHHRFEHDHFWSALQERVGPMPAVAQLVEDHAAVDAALDRVQRCFWELRHSRDFVVPQHELVSAIREARRLLQRYLDREDEEVVPAFRAAFHGREFNEVDPEVAKGLGFMGLAFAVPWGMGTMTDDERAALLPRTPLPLRMAYRVFRFSYQRKASALNLWAPRTLRFAAA